MDTARLSDLDSLSLATRDSQSHHLINEAISAYRGGAYRASIVATWIAVVADLFAKMRELSATGDTAAASLIQKLDHAIATNSIQDLQAIEGGVLDFASSDLAMLLSHEVDALRLLRKDRNRCAHPAFQSEDALYQPTPEITRAHIVHALTFLLVHAPLQGKAAIVRFEADVTGNAFPTEYPQIKTFLKQKYLERAKDVLVIALMKGVLIACFGTERERFYVFRMRLAKSLKAISEEKAALYESEMPPFVSNRISEIKDEWLLDLCPFLRADPRLFDWLTDSARIRLRTLVRKCTFEELLKFRVPDAMGVKVLREELMVSMNALMPFQQARLFIKFPRDEFKSSLLNLLPELRGWRLLEEVISGIVGNYSKLLSADDLKSILDSAARNDQIWSSFKMDSLFSLLFDSTLNLFPETLEAWKTFLAAMEAESLRLSSEDYAYPELRAKLQDHVYVAPTNQ